MAGRVLARDSGNGLAPVLRAVLLLSSRSHNACPCAYPGTGSPPGRRRSTFERTAARRDRPVAARDGICCASVDQSVAGGATTFDALSAALTESGARAQSRSRRADAASLSVTMVGLLVAAAAVAWAARRVNRASRRSAAEEAERRALDASEKRLRALLHDSADAVVVVTSTGRVSYATPALFTLASSATTDADGIDLAELVHPDDRASIKCVPARRRP